MSIPKFTKDIMDPDFEAKVNTFIVNNKNVEVIIAGDSRAERQLIPSIFENQLNRSTVNIAKDVGDIVSLLYANDKYDFIDSNKILIIGVSSLLINDGAYKNWFMSQASITELNIFEQLLLFKADYPENWYRRMGLIWDDLINPKAGTTLDKNDIRNGNYGYYPINKKIDIENFYTTDFSAKTTEHLWYRKPNNDGIRKKLFVESVNELAKTGARIVLIQSPMAPTWKTLTQNNYMEKLELDFSKLIRSMDTNFSNIWSIDFYTNQSNVFTDQLFYNATHLNQYGAVIFSSTVADSIKRKGIID